MVVLDEEEHEWDESNETDGEDDRAIRYDDDSLDDPTSNDDELMTQALFRAYCLKS